jgi:superoxide reductase
MSIANKIQSADWKAEKHVPVIDCPDTVQAGKPFQITVTVGKEIAHPNTIEHHINWIEVYFNPEGDKFVYDVGRFEFNVHGEADVFAAAAVTATITLSTSGTLQAVSHCNIHGLWESEKTVKVG